MSVASPASVITAFWCTFLWLVLATRQTAWTAIFRMSWLRGIGRISYGVYLFHGLISHLVVPLIGHSAHERELGGFGFFLRAYHACAMRLGDVSRGGRKLRVADGRPPTTDENVVGEGLPSGERRASAWSSTTNRFPP